MLNQLDKKEFLSIVDKLENWSSIFSTFWYLGRPTITENPRLCSTLMVAADKDGHFIKMFINKYFWESNDEYTQLFLICHECLHVILLHGLRCIESNIEFNRKTNIALDLVVNHMLINSYGFEREKINNWQDAVWLDTIWPDRKVPERKSFKWYLNELNKEDYNQNFNEDKSHDYLKDLYEEFSDLLDSLLEEIKDNLSPELNKNDFDKTKENEEEEDEDKKNTYNNDLTDLLEKEIKNKNGLNNKQNKNKEQEPKPKSESESKSESKTKNKLKANKLKDFSHNSDFDLNFNEEIAEIKLDEKLKREPSKNSSKEIKEIKEIVENNSDSNRAKKERLNKTEVTKDIEILNYKKKKSWYSILERKIKKREEDYDMTIDWSFTNRKYHSLISLNPDMKLPNKRKKAISTRYNVNLYLDSSGSCRGQVNNFITAAKSFDISKIKLRIFLRDSEVTEVTNKLLNKNQTQFLKNTELTLKGYGQTDNYHCIEKHLLSNKEKYPDFIIHITDGGDCSGKVITPIHPERWLWVLTPYAELKWIPQKCKDLKQVYLLSDFIEF